MQQLCHHRRSRGAGCAVRWCELAEMEEQPAAAAAAEMEVGSHCKAPALPRQRRQARRHHQVLRWLQAADLPGTSRWLGDGRSGQQLQVSQLLPLQLRLHVGVAAHSCQALDWSPWSWQQQQGCCTRSALMQQAQPQRHRQQPQRQSTVAVTA